MFAWFFRSLCVLGFPSFFWSVVCPPRPFLFLLLFLVLPSCFFFVLSRFGVRGNAVASR